MRQPFSYNAVLKDWRFQWVTAGLALAWSALLLVWIVVPLISAGHRSSFDIAIICTLVAAGAFLGFSIARIFVGAFLSHQSRATRFSALLLFIVTLSIGLIALFNALYFRTYFAQWHAPVFTIYWFAQFVFTVAYAVYLFASNTLHQLISPVFLAMLFFVSWFADPGPRVPSGRS